jgi:hypothetical protein
MFFPRPIDPKIAKYIQEQTNTWLQRQKEKYLNVKQPTTVFTCNSNGGSHSHSHFLLPWVSLLSFTIGFYFAKNISSSSL